MNVRHRPVQPSVGGFGRLGGLPGQRMKSKKRLINKDNVGFLATVSFVLLGLALFLFFDFHHHEYDIDTGKEVEANEASSDSDDSGIESATSAAHKINDELSVEDAKSGGAESDGGSLRGRQQSLSEADENNISVGPRFVTVVLPSVVNPAGRPKRLDSIAATWGPEARAVYVVHDTGDYLNGANNQVGFSADGSNYPKLLLIPGRISENEGVPRLQHTIRTIHESIDPDFAFFVNDHTFVIPEHLCVFLSQHDPAKELYAGHAMKNEKEGYAFNSGAAGYILSRRTMNDLVKKWEESDPKCVAEHAAKWLQNNPGLVTAKCLRESMHVNAIDTRDENGRHRFHAFGLVRTVTGNVDEWYLNKHRGLDVIFGVDKHHHQHVPLKGDDCCSSATVSFHYVEYAETRAFYEVREKLKRSKDMSDEDLKAMIISSWPEGRDTGAYAHGLPGATNTEVWANIISVFRRISTYIENSETSLSPPC